MFLFYMFYQIVCVLLVSSPFPVLRKRTVRIKPSGASLQCILVVVGVNQLHVLWTCCTNFNNICAFRLQRKQLHAAVNTTLRDTSEFFFWDAFHDDIFLISSEEKMKRGSRRARYQNTFISSDRRPFRCLNEKSYLIKLEMSHSGTFSTWVSL